MLFRSHVDDSPEGRAFLARLEAKYDEIAAPKLPAVLIRAQSLTKRDAGENVVVTTYNPFDAFSLEKELFEVLEMFSADQTVEENLARLDKEKDIQLAPELLQYLFIHGVLAPPEKEKEKPGDKTKAEVAVAAKFGPRTANRQDRRASGKPKTKPTPKKR